MARYCDLCVIMKKGELVAIGEPKKIITPELIKEVYGVEASVGIDNEGDLYVLPKRVKIEQQRIGIGGSRRIGSPPSRPVSDGSTFFNPDADS